VWIGAEPFGTYPHSISSTTNNDIEVPRDTEPGWRVPSARVQEAGGASLRELGKKEHDSR